MSGIPKVENESDSSTESEKLDSENINTPEDFSTASEGPSLFEIVELLLSTSDLDDSSQDNLNSRDTYIHSSIPPVETSLLPTETSLPPSETSLPPTETLLPPIETSRPPIETSFPPTSYDKNVSLLVSEGNVQIKNYPNSVATASVNEFSDTKSKENCTNVHIEIVNSRAIKLTSLPSQDNLHQDVTLDILSELKNCDIAGALNDKQLEQGQSNAETLPAVVQEPLPAARGPLPAARELKSATKSCGNALPIVQAIHEIVDLETLQVIKKNLKDKLAEKQQADVASRTLKQQQHVHFPTFDQNATVEQHELKLTPQPNQGEAAVQPRRRSLDFATEKAVPEDIKTSFNTFSTLEKVSLVEEERASELSLNRDTEAFNTFEEYLKNESNDVDIQTLLKDQFIDRDTFQKIISTHLYNKTVLFDAICKVNQRCINRTAENNVISSKSSICSEGPTTSKGYTCPERSTNSTLKGDIVEVGSKSISQQKDDEVFSTHKEWATSRNDEETVGQIQCTIPRDLSDHDLTFPQGKCIEKSSLNDVSIRQYLQGQYLAEVGCCIENYANASYNDNTSVFPNPICTTSDGIESSCDVALYNHLDSFKYDFESTKLKTVHLTAEQVHVTTLDGNLKTVNEFEFVSHKDIPRVENIDKYQIARSTLHDHAKIDNVKVDNEVDTVKEFKVKEENVKADSVKEDNIKVDKIKEDELNNNTLKVGNVVVVNSNAGKSIEFACSLKGQVDNIKANLSINEQSGFSFDQGIVLNDTNICQTDASENTLEVSLIYRKINQKTIQQKMNDTKPEEIFIKEAPQKEKPPIHSKDLDNGNKANDAESNEAIVASTVAEMKKLFEQKPIMMSPPGASQDDGSRQSQTNPAAREVNQSVVYPASQNKEEQERRSSLKKEILAQIGMKPNSARPTFDLNNTTDARPSFDLNNTTDKGLIKKDITLMAQDDGVVLSKPVHDPSMSRGVEAAQPKHSSTCQKNSKTRHCSETNRPSSCNTRCIETQTIVPNCPCCCLNNQPETKENKCSYRTCQNRHSSSGQFCEQSRTGSCLHRNCSLNPLGAMAYSDEHCSCSRAYAEPLRASPCACSKTVKTERNCCFRGQENYKCCKKTTEREQSSQREVSDKCCGTPCCQRKHSAKCIQEDSECFDDVSDGTYTANDRSWQSAKECFKTRLDANYTALRICFKPNGKIKLCPEDCSCRDAGIPDTSMSFVSEVCIEASYAQSDSSSSDDMRPKQIKFSPQCDTVTNEDSDEEITGESRV